MLRFKERMWRDLEAWNSLSYAALLQAPRLKQAMRTHKIRSEAARELRKAAQAGTFAEETAAYGWDVDTYIFQKIQH